MNEGGTKTYDIKLNSRGTGDVTVTPSSSNGDIGFNPTSLTFTTANWDTDQTVTVRAAADEDTDDETAPISYTASGGDYPAITDTTSFSILDTTPTLQLLTDPSAVSEGTAISLTVTSDKARTGTLPVRLTLAARSSSTFTAADIPGTQGPRNFDAVFGNTASRTGTVSIPTSTDSATEGAEAYQITLSDGTGYAVGTDVTADGTLNDLVTAGVTISKETLTVEEDGSGTYTVVLDTDPGAQVVVTPTSGDTDKATVSGALTFTTATNNWSTAQTVTVTGVAVGSATINHSVRLTGASADAIPQGDTVKVTVGTPTAGVTLSRKTLAVTEATGAGNNATYTVRLNTAPTAAVTVTPTSGDAVVTVSGALTFTTSNYNDEQIVTVTGVDDSDADSETVTISHSAASTDTNYGSSLSIDSVSVSVTDDDSETTTVPDAPTGFSAAAGNAQVTLTWDDPDDDDITGYKVRYGKKTARRNAEWAAIDNSDADTTTHTVTGLDNNAEYSFKVRAVNSAGDGTATDWVDATPVAATVTIKLPEGLTVVRGPDRLYLSWTAPTDANRTGWRVRYRRVTGINTYGAWSEWTAITGAATTSYTITGLTRATYQVAVAATGASNAASTAATVDFVNIESGVT